MPNPNNPQMPDDQTKKSGGFGKPMPDQGQKAQPKDLEKDKSKDLNKPDQMGNKPGQGRQH